MTLAELHAAQIKRLAGLSNVVGALLASIDSMEPGRQEDALATCADLAGDIADDLNNLTERTK